MQDIQADINQGKALGITGTPSVFINGRKIPSFRADTVETIVDHLASESDGP
jgi:protein-disulfide isomerase